MELYNNKEIERLEEEKKNLYFEKDFWFNKAINCNDYKKSKIYERRWQQATVQLFELLVEGKTLYL